MRVIILKSKRVSILVLIFIAFALVSFNSENNESLRRFWGSETICYSSGSSSDGNCRVVSCYTTYYVFWLATSRARLTGMTIECTPPPIGDSDAYQEKLED